ncbi:MAG: MmgE/PrpD family protein [Armatimonadota bacterium]|nr:MmgE/PrpD family protein [Armatimonadota bacterium]MDR7485094.1 MmgE/PrpD family protein [Armatimonadota bacterium]MDR7533482.1 MmgE/PrpD family protein [Armatimonadota bacterium]MDR7537017.1 MmgE/PrpD family protein [Armatimonadota bacterium]
MTLARRLAEYMAGLAYEAIPAQVIHEAKRRAIDAVACAMGAADEAPITAARRAAGRLSGGGRATVLASGERVAPDAAAFVNGYMVRYLDYNDTYLSREALHPSDNLAGLLAAAEDAGASGRDLLAALVAAYEIVCRLADASSIRDRGWDHVTYGGIAVAAGATRLLGGGVDAIEQAINIAAATGINLRQTRVGHLSMWKGAAYGGASHNAVFAAYLATEGITGPSPVFEGRRGFMAQVSGPLEIPPMAGEQPQPTVDELRWEEEGGRPADEPPPPPPATFKLLETAIKYWPAEYHSQAAIAAALDLRRQGLRPEAIDRVVIRTFRVAVEIIGGEAEKWAPTTRETADHSMPYLVAAALLDGEITARQFAPDRIQREEIRALLARTEVVEQADLTAAYPSGIPTVVKVHERSGRAWTARVDFPPGHARNPLSDAQLEEKFRRLAHPVLGLRTDTALRALRTLERCASVREVISLLVRPGAAAAGA